MASTPLQLIEQATRHAAHLERLKSHEVKAFAEFLEQMQAQILRFLSRKELTEFSSRRLEDQLKAVRETLRQPLQDYRAVWREQIAELAKYEAGFEARSLDKVAANYQFSIPSDEQLRVAVFGNPLSARGASGGMLLDSFYQHFEDAQIDRLSNSLRMGYAQGRTNQQIAREALGLMQDDSRRAAEAITRTALQHAANQARAATWAANSDIVRKVRIVATLDDRTSIQCFPAGTAVRSCGSNKQVFRAEYAGEMFVITTSAGKKIEGTPNHPVLTARGFLPINELQPGDKVINASFNQGVMVFGDENVSVESDIGEVYNAAKKNTFFDVSRKTSSAVDFYGDGQGMDGDIHIATSKRHLSGDFITTIRQRVSDILLRFVQDARSFFSDSHPPDLIIRRLADDVAPKLNAAIFEESVNHGFGATEPFSDFDGLDSLLKHLQGCGPVSFDVYVTLSALQLWHDFMLFEKRRYSCCGDAVLPSDIGRADSIAVEFDDVVGVVSEFRRCHVYTLSSGLGFYTAEGIIVQNCQSLDGQVFDIDKGPRPPFHVNCRTTTVAVLDDRFKVLDEGRTRSERDPETGKVGSVPARQTYYGWLKGQSASVQDSIIGPTRGKLLRDGGLSAQRFSELQLGKNFEPLTLDQMRQLEPVAFQRAGV